MKLSRAERAALARLPPGTYELAPRKAKTKRKRKTKRNPEPAKWKRELAREQTKRAQAERTAKIRELRAELAELRRARANRLRDVRARCKSERAELKVRHRERREALRAEIADRRAALRADVIAARAAQRDALRTERENTRARCKGGTVKRYYAHKREKLEAAIRAEQSYRRSLADTKARSGVRKAVARRESDEMVEADLPPDLVELWRKHAREFRGSPRKSRAEEFLEWAERSPEAVLAAQADAADADVERMIREHEAELERLANPKRKRRANPATDAEAAFEAFHWGRRPRRKKVVAAPPVPAEAFELGPVLSITYEATKGRTHAAWEHDFEEPRPTLAADPDGKRLILLGGGYRVTKRGIEG